MELELERTFLIKAIPDGLAECDSIEIVDIYIPTTSEHPVLRIRKRGERFEMTKKYPAAGMDSSEQEEHTIALSKEEYEELARIEGKRFRKRRYFYPIGERTAEVDVYSDKLEGLVVVDVEFDSPQSKNDFEIPDFCLVDVTQDKLIAGGMLAGKAYTDLELDLKKYGYEKK